MALLPAADQPANSGAKPKSLAATIIATTPVVLTLLSTLLAGVSSSEMVRAQYFRSLAAQYQSKTGDQWNFFQAKRIRSTIIEQDLDLGQARPYQVDPARLEAGLQQLVRDLQTGRKEAGELDREANQVATDHPLRQTARRLVESAAGILPSPGAIHEAFQSKDVADAFSLLGTDKLPGRDPKGTNERAEDGEIIQALQAVKDRKPEKEIGALVLRIGEDRLQETVEAAEAEAQAYEKAREAVEKEVFKPIDRLVKQLDRQAYWVHRATRDLDTAWREMEDQGQKDQFRARVAALQRTDAAVQQDREVLADYQAARKDYTARRQEQEARQNEQIGRRYELRVHYNSAVSDQHRLRSLLFFMAMLLAQGGAALGSLAMAGRHRTSLWSLASIIGLGAVLVAAYVFLFIAPAPLAGSRPF